MITADGWLDFAERQPCPLTKTNPGPNGVKGIFLHSAEGYTTTLLDLAKNGPVSWHLSNLMDGRLIQHYPLTARCWHATAANNQYVGMENEGRVPREPSLNEPQIANAVRVIKELEQWKGWTASRPLSATDTLHTLWEHKEVVRLGGSATACPSGRIPWSEILRRLEEPVEEAEVKELNERRAKAEVDIALLFRYRTQWVDGTHVRLVNNDGSELNPPVVIDVGRLP